MHTVDKMGLYSLWIEPKDNASLTSQLQTVIDELRRQHNGVHFVPHVTLAAFEAKDDDAAREMTEKLVGKLEVLLTFTV